MSNKLVRELAQTYGCDGRTIRRWATAAAPLHDLAAMLTWLDGRPCLPDKTEKLLPALREQAASAPAAPAAKQEPPAPAEPPGSLRAARLKKLELESERLAFENAVSKGRWTHNDEIARVSVAWAAQLRAELMLLIPEAPCWAGLAPAELADRAKQFVHTALGRLGTFHAPDAPR